MSLAATTFALRRSLGPLTICRAFNVNIRGLRKQHNTSGVHHRVTSRNANMSNSNRNYTDQPYDPASRSNIPLTQYNSLREAIPGMHTGRNDQPGPGQMYPGPYNPSGTPQQPHQFRMSEAATVQGSYAGSTQYPSAPYTSSGAQQDPTSMQWAGATAPAPQSTWISPHGPHPSGQESYHSGFPVQHPSAAVAPLSHGAHANTMGLKQCSRCQTVTTPLWRRDPATQEPLCNACGLYVQQRHTHRPQELIEADRRDGGGGSPSSAPADGRECTHCGTHQTSVWRRDKDGNQVCNACGVYERLRGVPRPLALKREGKPRPRPNHSHSF